MHCESKEVLMNAKRSLDEINKKSSMKKILLYMLCVATLLLTGCGTRSKTHQHHRHHADTLRYATLLDMEAEGEVTFCRIANPWNEEQTLAQYLLLPRDTTLLSADKAAALEEQYPDYMPLYVPLQRITLTAGCQAYLLAQLGALDHVAVMCDADYVHTAEVQAALQSGAISDGGNAASPNVEVIMAAECDAAWISPFENVGSGSYSRLPMPVVFCADYMETSPLARAEWMKFYGKLVGKSGAADSLFHRVERQYLAGKNAMSQGETNSEEPSEPKLLAESITGATWYVPGGSSTMGQLYADAGADYLWREDNHAGSLSLSPEAVLTRAEQCDVWLLKYYQTDGDLTLRAFVAQHPYYARFKAAAEGNVYGCNTATSDYFDETPFRPDLLLYSVRRMLHPELPDTLLLPRDTLVKKSQVRMDTLVDRQYFKRLK
jgi:iron complex transport system substrate-binding protein